MTHGFNCLVASFFLILGSCSHTIEDEADVCVFTTEVDGQSVLRVRAYGFEGTADHPNTYLKCTITVDGLDAHIETLAKIGKDPNDAVGGALRSTCEVAVEAGDYTLDYDGEERMISVPGGEHVCFGFDFNTGTEY